MRVHIHRRAEIDSAITALRLVTHRKVILELSYEPPHPWPWRTRVLWVARYVRWRFQWWTRLPDDWFYSFQRDAYYRVINSRWCEYVTRMRVARGHLSEPNERLLVSKELVPLAGLSRCPRAPEGW